MYAAFSERSPSAAAPDTSRTALGRAAGFGGNAGGGGLRVRAGVGGRQEVGVEGTVLAVDTGKASERSSRWIGNSLAYGWKLSWKGAPRDWFAVVAGAGGSSAATGNA